MADCGAAGSALDRAAAALAGGGSAQHAAQQKAAAAAVASLLGAAASTARPAGGGRGMGMGMAGMAAAPPDLLRLPGGGGGGGSVPPAAAAAAAAARADAMDGAWGGAAPPGPQMQMQMQMPMQAQMSMQMQGAHPAAAARMMAVQQQQHMHMVQQQQMHMMRAQQMHAMQQQMQAQAQAQAQQQSATGAESRSAPLAAARDAADVAAESWHDGLVEDVEGDATFAEALRAYRADQDGVRSTAGDGGDQDLDVDTDADAEYDVLGHDGFTEGASIEQLAAAWAEAEDEARRDAEAAGEAYGGAGTEADAVDAGAAVAAARAEAEAEAEAAAGWGIPGGEEEMRPYSFSDASVLDRAAVAPPGADLMARGMRRFREGDLPEAIRLFEAELQHVDPDSSDAWRMLGKCHAENDQDRRAIACLERAVDRDPYSVEALLALGTSYVNELDYPRALRNLKAWATHNPAYAGMKMPGPRGAPQGAAGVAGREREQMAMEEAKGILAAAVEFDPTQAADAMEAMAVVCNVTREYDVAIEYLQRSIDARPDDYQLHNKLGATLANSNRSEEALEAYHRALRLKPRYARAWLNMAISHSNLHNYSEAARCYLQTLSLNPSAQHVWSYLRIALTCSEKWDLLPAAAAQNLDLFKEHYDFVQY